jgi:glycosyltransferase involved in cell wall biosynthesis
LFVPVSGAFGMGEYARCLAIAQGAAARWPAACIRFVLSRQAPYAGGVPFPATLLDSSPTFHPAAVIAILRDWRPDVVIFDNAGRTSQLRAAARGGAKVIYISARRRQRNKAFRPGWMRVIDEHWIAYPRFVAGGLGWLERLKLRLLRRPQVRYLDVILARPAAAAGSVAARLGCTADGYVLLVPGGGTGHPGAADATERFLAAARALAASGTDTVLVAAAAGAPAAGDPAAGDPVPGAPAAPLSRLRLPGPLPQGDLAELMRGARLIIANGGSTLLQAIACGRPCIGVPIADDQPRRIRRCVEAGVAVAAALDADAIHAAALDLLRDEPAAQALAARARALGLADGVEVAVGCLANLIHA